MLSQTFNSEAQSMQPSTTSGASNQAEQHLRAQLELLKNHDVGASLSSPSSVNPRDQRNASIQPAPPRPSNGYDDLTTTSQDAARAIAKSSVDAHIHPDLRARPHHAQTATMMPIAPPTGHEPGASAGPSASALAPAPPMSAHNDDGLNDGRKAKRELSQSKRAAQNRAAQRAFRQRKEGYIKKLEQQVRDYMQMESTYKNLQDDNYALRQYALTCQSRLMEVAGEFPPPPSNINLSQPPAVPDQQTSAPDPAPSNVAMGTPLEAVAQAVAGLAAHEQMRDQQQSYPSPTFKPEQSTEDIRSADEINRQLQSEGGPAPAV